jgi:hypothetical protein
MAWMQGIELAARLLEQWQGTVLRVLSSDAALMSISSTINPSPRHDLPPMRNTCRNNTVQPSISSRWLSALGIYQLDQLLSGIEPRNPQSIRRRFRHQ